ncbi:MAG: AI-2E family transporter [Chloroflexi bacterium]|nr:AI-2E family transporter [Chloroflexota bacterium]
MPIITSQRRNRLGLIAALVVILLVVLWAARGALFPYIFALVLAYLMLPAVNWLDRMLARPLKGARASRPLAIVLVYLLTIGLVVAFFSLVVPVVSRQFQVLWAHRDDLVAQTQQLAAQGLTWYQEAVPPNIQVQIADALRRAADTITSALQSGVIRTFSVLTSTVSFIIGMSVVPFWLFYLLNDSTKAQHGLLNLIPGRFRADFVNLLRITDGIFGAYLRGQLLLCVFIGVMATVGLMALGVQYSALLGLLAGMFEILPFIGPILGLVPAVIVAAIQSPLLGLWTLLLFLAIQQIENLFLVPRISGQAVQLHPAVIMVVLVVGNEVAGLWGMILVVPLAAIIRDLFKYLYLRFQDEPVTPREAMIRLGRRA